MSDVERRIAALEDSIRELRGGRDNPRLNFVRMEIATSQGFLPARELMPGIVQQFRLRAPKMCKIQSSRRNDEVDAEEGSLVLYDSGREVPVYGIWQDPSIGRFCLIGQTTSGIWVLIREDCL